jgi:hypothetical protein
LRQSWITLNLAAKSTEARFAFYLDWSAFEKSVECPSWVLCHEHRRLIRGAQLYER